MAAHAGSTPSPMTPVFCLSEVEVFQDLTPQEMADLAAHAPMRTAPAGTLLWSPHEPRPVLFIVKVGSVRIYRLSPEGRRLTLAVLGPGALFGEMELIGQRMGEGFAETLEPSVLCLMSEQDVRSMLLSDTRIATRMITGLGRRLAEVEQRLADTVLKTVPQRVAGVLCRLATAAPPETGLFPQRGPHIRLTHEQLAELVGTTRETATKLLGDFRATGLVGLRRGGIVVLDLEGLRAVAEHGEQSSAHGHAPLRH
ncbi:Crp/Fnr family transcriptional regulator [Modestobacter caceresii]|uniref:Crp/Fnr family transcriptional regulator n=1 Tax=Modestobacter caceresii TaxID=1522368 RepID=UPI0007ED7083|nr:Crp/Fnr family transcriptional regulator [Modestobacter caceresii]